MNLPQSGTVLEGSPSEPVCRVMVVDGSAAMRGLICRVLTADPAIAVVATAGRARSALTALADTAVDVVVLDSDLDDRDDGALLAAILEIAPEVRVVMAAPLTPEGAATSVRAMASGAADYVTKPSLEERRVDLSVQNSLTEKVKALAAPVARVTDGSRRRPAAKGSVCRSETPNHGAGAPAKASPRRQPIKLRSASEARPEILAVAASTGGPPALFRIFRALGNRISAPILITQHMPQTFTAALADRLSAVSGFAAAEARDGEPVEAGHIYVAPGDRHMRVQRRGDRVALRVTRGPRENFCRPAADPMFRSVAEVYGDRALALVLTGMGRDGLDGCAALAAAHATVIAQDEATSVVWGMPGAVAGAGLCSAVLPLDDIADDLATRFGGGS